MLPKALRMKPKQNPASGDADRLRTRHSSFVLLSAQSQVPGSRAALPDLCGLRRYPLDLRIQSEGSLGS